MNPPPVPGSGSVPVCPPPAYANQVLTVTKMMGQLQSNKNQFQSAKYLAQTTAIDRLGGVSTYTKLIADQMSNDLIKTNGFSNEYSEYANIGTSYDNIQILKAQYRYNKYNTGANTNYYGIKATINVLLYNFLNTLTTGNSAYFQYKKDKMTLFYSQNPQFTNPM